MRLFGRTRKVRVEPASQRRRVLFVSHEATRTGAPKIILNVLRHLTKTCDIQAETILLSGGHLAASFAEHSLVDCLNLPKESSPDLTKRISRLVNREKHNPPVLAICNSMESRFITKELHAHKIPNISLVHELPSSYLESDYQTVFDASQKVVFPVHAVRDAVDMKMSMPAGKSLVLPQGLLNPSFGTRIDRETARQQICQEIGLPDNAFIVLGCGTLDLRKGIDHYAAIARRVCETHHATVPIHFVWVGGGPRWTHSTHHYVQLDIDKSVARNHVHFIGERDDVEPYFVAADTFLMSSRVDPFPCVIHEAMAVGLPVIAFENAGGAPEAIDNGAGFVVRYADYEQTASIIKLLACQPDVANGVRERSRQRVSTRYRFADYADRLIELSESVIGQRLRHSEPPKRLRIAA